MEVLVTINQSELEANHIQSGLVGMGNGSYWRERSLVILSGTLYLPGAGNLFFASRWRERQSGFPHGNGYKTIVLTKGRQPFQWPGFETFRWDQVTPGVRSSRKKVEARHCQKAETRQVSSLKR